MELLISMQKKKDKGWKIAQLSTQKEKEEAEK